ncbi:MAG: PHP domain-containing protein, partial [Clostridiales bacterium]|nr:PHP domain-containing protein [Clostridiales bacterium]
MEQTQTQTFPEVFPDYHIPDNLRYVLSNTVVTKVVMKRSSNHLIVHLKGEHILSKKLVNKVAFDLKNALFKGTSLFISIDDTYELSSAYTLEQLTKDYWDSILYEVKGLGQVEYSLFLRCEWGFEGDIMTVLLEDSFLARNKAKELKEYLEHMYRHRFGKEVHVGFDFTDHAKNAFYKARNHKLGLEVGMVMDQIEKAEMQKGDSADRDKNGEGEGRKPARRNTAYTGNFFEERARRKEFGGYSRKQKDPDIIYGKDCDGEVVPIEEITDEIGETVIRGQIIKMEIREIRRERTIVSFHITDFTDSIVGKVFLKNDMLQDFLDQFAKGKFYKVKGMPRMDTFEHDIAFSSIMGIKPIPDFRVKRMDKSLEKRVELHLHTVMSDLDSVVDIKKVINTAKEWGHPALAITDHGVLQAFPIANHCITMEEPFKIIYGVEGYFVDDLKKLVVNAKGQSLQDDFVVFDLETTGFSPVHDAIIEIGAVKVQGGEITDHYSVFVNPGRPIPLRITELTSIDDAMVADAEAIETILPEFLAFCEGCSLVAHNAEFDVSFIEENARRLGYAQDFTVLDTVQMARLLLPELNRFKLNTVCKHLGIKQEHHHRAVDDARVTAEVFLRFVEMLRERDITTIDQLNEMGHTSADLIKKDMTYHGMILVNNETGRVSLNS